MVDVFSYFKQTVLINKQLSETVKKANSLCSDLNFKKSYSETRKALSLCSEELINLRELMYSLYYENGNSLTDFENSSLSLFDISIEPVKNIPSAHKITMPFILPNQRSNFDSWKKTIGDSLFSELSDYVRDNNIKKLQYGFIAIVSNFTGEKLQYVCDNDNKEIKDTINIIAKTLIDDDNGLICDMYLTSKLTSKLNTEIYVGKKENIIDIIKLTL